MSPLFLRVGRGTSRRPLDLFRRVVEARNCLLGIALSEDLHYGADAGSDEGEHERVAEAGQGTVACSTASASDSVRRWVTAW